MFRTIPCSKCGTEIGMNRIKTHERLCDGFGPARRRKTVIFETDVDGKKICPDCGKKCSKYGAATHWRIAHRGDYAGRPLGTGPAKGKSWNRGLTKETDERIARACANVSEGVRRYVANMTDEDRKKRSEIGRRKSPTKGGPRKGAGRGKSGWYQGFWCDSSWELAWVIHAIDHSISFSRNTLGYEYEFEGKRSKFYPDFLLGAGNLVEVKGYFDRRNNAKIAAVEGLTVLGEKEIKPYLLYAVERFGTDFVSAAYQQPPEYRCCDCGTAVTNNAPRCARCAGLKSAKYKIQWPTNEQLIDMIGLSNRNQVAKRLGVSFSAIAKRLKVHGLVAPM